jgi:hypothetical protein
MRPSNRLYRPASLLLAVLVATLTIVIVAHATQTITTPNAMYIAYTLAAKTSSGPITPQTFQPVKVMGVDNSVGQRGVGEVTLLRSPSSPAILEWIGLDPEPGPPVTAIPIYGDGSTAGTHIVFLTNTHTVDLEVNSSSAFMIHNAGTTSATGDVVMFW